MTVCLRHQTCFDPHAVRLGIRAFNAGDLLDESRTAVV